MVGHWRRRIGVAGMCLLFAALSLPRTSLDAYAVTGTGDPYCPHGGNWVSEACFYQVIPQYGTYAEFHNNYMWLNPGLVAQGQHVNQSIWAYSGNPCLGQSSTYWVEEGISQGWHGANSTVWYYATNNTISGYSDYMAGNTSYNGSNHAYRLEYDGVGGSGTGKYAIVRDGVYLAYFEGLGYGTCMSAGGYEESNAGHPPDTNYHSDTYDFLPLEWQDSSYSYHSGWASSVWIDYPCGSGQGPPYCFNGVYYGNTHWADNKP